MINFFDLYTELPFKSISKFFQPQSFILSGKVRLAMSLEHNVTMTIFVL